MSKIESKNILPDEIIITKILYLRGKKVMIDYDLAALYGVPTKRLKEQVKRNINRFPEHFMFELTKEEKDELVANCDQFKNLKHSSVLPYAFTEYGVLQAANVLNSERAVIMGNRIIEVFVRMYEMLASHKEVLQKLEKLIKNDVEQDQKIMLIFEYLKQFEEAKQQHIAQKEQKPIGYK